MRTTCAIATLIFLAACATPYNPQEVEAVRDYVVANELEEVDEMRVNRQLSYAYVNDHFVTVSTRRSDYLIELNRRCLELRRVDFTPEMIDRRSDSNLVRARFDTIRGCQIGKIYEISDEQRKELKDLGDAPGEEVFIPDEDDSK